MSYAGTYSRGSVFRTWWLLIAFFLVPDYVLSAQSNSGIDKPTVHPFEPGDAVKIRAYPDTTDFPNGVYPIGDDGYANLPFVGLTKVTGRTAESLEEALQQVYMEHLRSPNLQFESMIRISTVGGFHSPGLYWVSPRASLWEVVNLAGGPLRDDGIEKMRWRREARDIPCDIGEMFQSGKSLLNMGVESGDQFVVTPLERRRPIDIITGDVLPVMSFIVSTITAAATVYLLVNDNE